MDYQETIEYLYNATPQFQRIGAAAYKPGLDTARELSGIFRNPYKEYPTIHVAGTNGKGSVCHTLAAILQCAGLKTGLYTSPHLVDFRERIRVDGEMISRNGVVDFVEKYRCTRLYLSPSFFELTTIMAFDWFKTQNVDIAVIETGLGGRLDTTNIINPILSIITNISFDHTAQLSNTLRSIANEKAGIIKNATPVIIGDSSIDETFEIFEKKARNEKARLVCADRENEIKAYQLTDNGIDYVTDNFGEFLGELGGNYQVENTAIILSAVKQLRRIGYKISDEAVKKGFRSVTSLTGLTGRWTTLSEDPLIICDTGHNEGGWAKLSSRLNTFGEKLIMVIGFVRDKDIDKILRLMPREATYIFCNAFIPRALPAEELKAKAEKAGLSGMVIRSVSGAYEYAKSVAKQEDKIVFIGGSTFVVADLIAYLSENK